MTNDGVKTAFELILEEIGSVSNELKNEAKILLDKGDFDSVSSLMKTGKELDKFQQQVKNLQTDWINNFDPKTRSKTQFTPLADIPKSKGPLALTMTYGEAIAQAEYVGSSIQILAGSTIRKKSHDSLNDHAKEMKSEAINKGEIAPSANPELYEVKTPIAFGSPSGAACFVAGCSVSGPKEWKVKREGISLKEWVKNHSC